MCQNSAYCMYMIYYKRTTVKTNMGFLEIKTKKELKWKMRTYKAKDCLEGNTAQKVITLDRIVYHN